MRGKTIVLGVALAALCFFAAALAQTAESVPRVGFLMTRTGPEMERRTEAFRSGLRELGYTEGQNIEILYRSAEGDDKRLPGLVADLLHRKVDVIVTLGGAPAIEVRKATRTVPIVLVVAGDLVSLGLVESVRRPGGNITGLSTLAPELMGKQLELMKELVPTLSRVAIIRFPEGGHDSMVHHAEEAAPRLGLDLVVVEVGGAAALPAAFHRIGASGAKGIVVLRSGFLLTLKERIAAMARAAGLPTVFGHREEVEAGGLLSYGADTTAMFRGSASYVVKILKGAKPADLPIAQSMRFLLDVNLQTAKALGISVPQSILLRADLVIE